MVDTVVVDGSALGEADVVAVAREGAGVRLAPAALEALAAARARIDELAVSDVPGLRRLHRLRRAGHAAHPRRAAQAAAAQPRPLACGELRPRGRPRGRPRPDAPAAADVGQWADRCTSEHGTGAGRPAVLRADARSCAPTAASAAPATWHRWRTWRWCSWARARCVRLTGAGPLAGSAGGARLDAGRADGEGRASRCSTGPTACSGCSSSPATTSTRCSASPTSPRR